MSTFQAFNKRTGAWVKFKKMKGKPPKIVNVKESKPKQKFKGVPVKGKRR